MKEITEVMDLAELPTEELASILKQGALLRLPYLQVRLRQAKEQVSSFEAKHDTTLDVLKRQGLPDDADYAMHEDFVEWEYWSHVAHTTEVAVASVQTLLEKMEETVDIH